MTQASGVPGTFLQKLTMEQCKAPEGCYRLASIDTLAHGEVIEGTEDDLQKAIDRAGILRGDSITESQTCKKVYVFDERGEVVHEAGSM